MSAVTMTDVEHENAHTDRQSQAESLKSFIRGRSSQVLASICEFACRQFSREPTSSGQRTVSNNGMAEEMETNPLLEVDIQVAAGKFWALDHQLPERSGRLHYGQGALTRLELDHAITRQKSVIYEGNEHESIITYTGRPEDVVADFALTDIQGTLIDGTRVTLLQAQGGIAPGLFGPGQRFTSRQLVVGAHVAGLDQLYESVRLEIPILKQMRHLANNRVEVGGDLTAGRLSAEETPDSVRLVYEPENPLPLRTLEQNMVMACKTMLSLCIHAPVSVRAVEVAPNSNGSWLPIQSPRSQDTEPTDAGTRLVPLHLITLERFAQWIERNSNLDGLAEAVASKQSGAIQVEVLTLASVAEGLHQRLYPNSVRFPNLGRAQQKRIRKKIKAAGLTAFEDEQCDDVEEADKWLTGTLGHLNDIPYRRRLAELLDTAQQAAPDIAGGFEDWPKLIHKVRNDMAHQNPNDRHPLERRVDEWALASRSLRWVLRTVLLVNAGFTDQQINTVYKRNALDGGFYGYYLANNKADLARLIDYASS